MPSHKTGHWELTVCNNVSPRPHSMGWGVLAFQKNLTQSSRARFLDLSILDDLHSKIRHKENDIENGSAHIVDLITVGNKTWIEKAVFFWLPKNNQRFAMVIKVTFASFYWFKTLRVYGIQIHTKIAEMLANEWLNKIKSRKDLICLASKDLSDIDSLLMGSVLLL